MISHCCRVTGHKWGSDKHAHERVDHISDADSGGNKQSQQHREFLITIPWFDKIPIIGRIIFEDISHYPYWSLVGGGYAQSYYTLGTKNEGN